MPSQRDFLARVIGNRIKSLLVPGTHCFALARRFTAALPKRAPSVGFAPMATRICADEKSVE
jgi:hypothetical protein